MPLNRSPLPVRRHSLPDTLANALRDRILKGEFREGDQLVQESIAKEYEVSRQPVREALRQLQASGLVVHHVNRGTVVTAIPVEQIAELFDLRENLESELLTYAIPGMGKADLADASTILDQLEQAYRKRDVDKWEALNWAFHRRLYKPSGRVQTLAIAETINLQTDRYIRAELIQATSVANAKAEHRELVALCAKKDVKAAVTQLKKHIRGTRRHLLEALAARSNENSA